VNEHPSQPKALLSYKKWAPILSVPIPGSRKLHRHEENIGAADIKLVPDDLCEIESAMSQISVVGNRYS
jgi:aryl-alcohol dehydrogenase-like predicted oxidoreductase